jgi:hypothetical protein
MELIPYCEATSCAAAQELPRTLWNPTAQYRVPESSPRVPVLGQISAVHII